MKRAIVDYHKDNENDWVARLSCGHFQHVRHNPPWTSRPWVETIEGRRSMIGHELTCKKCAEGAAPDYNVPL